MVHTESRSDSAADTSAQREHYVQAFRWMVLSRVLDEKFANLYRGGKIFGGVFLGRGQEALSVSVGISLRKGDVFAPLIRDGAGRLAFGETVLDAVRTYLGSPLGPMRSRDGNVHRGKPMSSGSQCCSTVADAVVAHRVARARPATPHRPNEGLFSLGTFL